MGVPMRCLIPAAVFSNISLAVCFSAVGFTRVNRTRSIASLLGSETPSGLMGMMPSRLIRWQLIVGSNETGRGIPVLNSTALIRKRLSLDRERSATGSMLNSACFHVSESKSPSLAEFQYDSITFVEEFKRIAMEAFRHAWRLRVRADLRWF